MRKHPYPMTIRTTASIFQLLVSGAWKDNTRGVCLSELPSLTPEQHAANTCFKLHSRIDEGHFIQIADPQNLDFSQIPVERLASIDPGQILGINIPNRNLLLPSMSV